LTRILQLDPSGDTLDVTDLNSFIQVQNLTFEINKNRVLLGQDGRVSVDVTGLNDNEIKNDKGLALIINLTTSKERQLFTVANEVLVHDSYLNNNFVYDVVNDKSGILNISKNGKDSNGNIRLIPLGDYDGQVIMAKSGTWSTNGGDSQKSVTFHELAENLYRNQGMDYRGNKSTDIYGAHYKASKLEGKFFGNNEPGSANFIPGGKFDKKRTEIRMLYGK
jgi:hypothetical protein